MEGQISTRWDLLVTLNAGKKALRLVRQYEGDFASRVSTSEITDFEANLHNLEVHSSGQTEKLTMQKMSTLNHQESKTSLYETLSSLRYVVKCSGASPSLLKAFGYGEKLSSSGRTLLAACNVALKAYEENKQWCNTVAGIIDEDMQGMRSMVEQLQQTEQEQSEAKQQRKLGTMSKNTAQAAVDAGILRFSALGAHIFRKKDQRIAQMFEDLVPIHTKNKQAEEKSESTEETVVK